MTVAVAVARADDDRPRWRRRHGARRGGQVAVAGRGGAPAAAAPAAGGGGDGRAFQGREPRGGHLAAAAARGGAARGQGSRGGDGDGHGGHGGGGGGAAGDAPVPGAGRGRGGGAGGFGDALVPGTGLGGGGGADYADARGGAGGRDGGGHRTGPPIKLREDVLDWLKGNVNNVGESSRGTASFADHYPDMNPKPLPKQKIRPAHNFLPFSEQELFQNNLHPQSPEIDSLNDDLVLLFESISVVRKNKYEMMCKVSEANDTSSYGKEIGEETRKADMLIKNAEDILSQIKDLGGEALPIPYQFYVGVKPLKP